MQRICEARAITPCVLLLCILWYGTPVNTVEAQDQLSELESQLDNSALGEIDSGDADLADDKSFDYNSADQAIQKMLGEAGIPPQSKFYSIQHDSILSSRKNGGSTVRSSTVSPNLPPQIVLFRVRGTVGKPLPTANEIGNPFEFSPESIKEAVENAREERKQGAAKMIADMVPRDLPKCSANQTYVIDRASEDKSKIAEINGDFLFIQRADLPLNPDEKFGKSTAVFGYMPDPQSDEAAFAMMMGIECLPSRLRITPDHVYWYEGDTALLNYDLQPRGIDEKKSGNLDLMKARLRPTKRGSRT